MDEELLEKIAYSMQRAYSINNNRDNAVVDVAHEFTDADIWMLRAMWQAIDAYYDMNIDV